MEKFERVLNKIKFKAFGKVTINERKLKSQKEDPNNSLEREDKKAKLLHDEQEKQIMEEIEKIKESKNGRAGRIWEIRKKY